MILSPFLVNDTGVFCVESKPALFGVDAGGEWLLSAHGSVYYLTNERCMPHTLPLLMELNYCQLRNIEELLSREIGLPVKPFPISDLLHQAFCGLISDYWVSRVVAWVKSGAMLDERLAGDFAKNVNNKALSQGIRQELKRFLKAT
jgi:hypothetical protein